MHLAQKYPSVSDREHTFVTVDTEKLTVTLPTINVNFNRIMGACVAESYRAGLQGAPCYTLIWRGARIGTIQLRELDKHAKTTDAADVMPRQPHKRPKPVAFLERRGWPSHED
jgi:hypothetical protein